jgi:hypothetical protein
MTPRTRFFFFILPACLWLSSCDLFNTRTPEEPSQKSSNYVPPTEPSLVFQNMTNAFRDANSVNYALSFADTVKSDFLFSFEPTPQAQLRYTGVFLQWTKLSEQQYFANMQSKLQNGAVPTLEFLTLAQQAIAADSTQFDVTYRLTIPHTQTNISTVAKGSAQFFLVADHSRNWVIRRWVDIAMSQSDFTWSEFKGAFAQ